MRKMNKIALMAVCCLSAFIGGIFMQKDVTTASAELTSIETVANHFYMEPGAYVRSGNNSAGIRFSTMVSKDWYALATKDGAQVSFYTLIDKYENEDANEAIKIPASNFALDEETGFYKFSGSIVYDNLEEVYQVAAHNMQLEGSAYAVVTKDGETQTIAAQSNDNVRSMAEVADNAIRTEAENGFIGSNEGAFDVNSEEILENYRIIKKSTTYIDQTNGTMDVDAIFEGANIVKVALADTADTYTDGKFTFNGTITTSALNESAIIYTDKGIIETSFKVCTKVIT